MDKLIICSFLHKELYHLTFYWTYPRGKKINQFLFHLFSLDLLEMEAQMNCEKGRVLVARSAGGTSSSGITSNSAMLTRWSFGFPVLEWQQALLYVFLVRIQCPDCCYL